MWLIDAVMHVELGADVHSESLWQELFTPHATTVVFRLIYLFIAIAFGVYLWRTNWRERQLRALEEAFTTFQFQLDTPALRIQTFVNQLQKQTNFLSNTASAELVEKIANDAKLIEELTEKYTDFSRQVQAGKITEATETLNKIKLWLAQDNS